MLALGLAAAGGVAVFAVYGSDAALPRIDHVGDYRPKVVTKVMSADGELIGEIFEERRTVIPRSQIPPHMVHAIVDAEDADFFQHAGLSYWGMARALLNDLRPGVRAQGASTLTQQLVRNLILKSNARTGMAGVKRKVQEMILARSLEQKLTKDEILALYLNQIDFGHQRFGVEEAARFYFGKSITQVDVGEVALLASLPKGTAIDPFRHPERAKERQRYVLSQMVRYHHLEPALAQKIARAPIKLVRSPSPSLGIAPEVVGEVKRLLLGRYGAERLAYLGAVVKTSLDARIQRLSRQAVEKGLVDLDARQGFRRPLARLKGAAAQQHLKKLKKEFPGGPSLDKVVEGVVVQIVVGKAGEPDGAKVDLGAVIGWLPLAAAVDRYNPKALSADKRFSVGDVLRVRVIDQPAGKSPTVALELGPQAAAVVLDPETREVKALVGGYGYRPGDFNRALAARRQPGSAFKPFLYATALATERFTPASVLNDSPQVYAQPGLKPWKPQNAERHEYLGPVRLRVALARSLNTVASQLIDVEAGGVGPDAVVAMAHSAGIDSKLEANPSLALGTSVVSLLELTNAYASFADAGRRTAPQFLRDVGGTPEPESARASVQAMKPEVAFVVTSLMTSVFEEGTAQSARGKLKRPVAGKTGTTDAERDAWFLGFTPDLVTGVWVGFDDMRELGHGEQGARSALPIWVEIMSGALKSTPPRPFTQPPGVVVERIDPKTGLLAPPGSVTAIEEVFLQGTAPTQVARAPDEANPDTFITDQSR